MAVYATAAGLPHPALWGEIGMAESSGSTTIVNSIGCVGVWQINQPEHVKTHPKWTVAYLKDPAHNAAAARVLYDAARKAGGSGYEPWVSSRGVWGKTTAAASAGLSSSSTSTTSATQAGWLDPLVPMIPGAPLLSGVGSTNPFQPMLDAGNWVSNPHNWLRVAYGLIGGVLVVVGINLMVQAKVLPAVSGAADLIPQGRAVKTAVSARKSRVAKQVDAGRAAKHAPKKAAPAKAPAPKADT